MIKKAQSFLALFIVTMALFFYGIYLYNSYVEIKNEQENYEKESNLITNLMNLKENSCVDINYYIKVSAFPFQDKGVIILGPFDYSIKGLTLSIPDFKDWPNELVSYKNLNSSYKFAYIKDNQVYVEFVYPFPIQPASKSGYIKSICLQNDKLIIY